MDTVKDTRNGAQQRNNKDKGMVETDDMGPLLIYGMGRERISIFPNDILCLRKGIYINDVIIDFWLAVIKTEFIRKEDLERIFIFDSYFYTRYSQGFSGAENCSTEETKARRHGLVMKRTKHTDIFSKDIIIVPINFQKHWIISIIFFPGLANYDNHSSLSQILSSTGKMPAIMILDSIPIEREARGNKIAATLRDYLASEYKVKKCIERVFDVTTIPHCCSSEVPIQRNGTDCGLYILQYIESLFCTSLFEKIAAREEWFPISEIESKRQRIWDYILSKILEINPANARLLPRI